MFGSAFATGKRVYGSGSFAPTRGQVSAKGAQGYIRRSLAQQAKKRPILGKATPGINGREGTPVGAMRVGNDGKSDTRSGVAQAALQRSGGFSNMIHNISDLQKSGQIPGKQTPPIKNQPEGKPAPKPVGSGNSTGGTVVPKVTINANGQLELPYDANYSDAIYSNLADFNNQLMQLQMGQQQQAQQYQQQLRDENLGFQQQQQTDLQKAAGNGMAFSSQYARAVGQTSGAHQNAINDLDAANGLYGQQVSAQKAALQDNFNQQLQAAAQQRARDAYQNAGNLGYGKAKPKQSKPQPVKHKPQPVKHKPAKNQHPNKKHKKHPMPPKKHPKGKKR